MTKISDDLF